MKRLFCILLVLELMTLTVFANPNMSGDVGNIDVPMASPTIDGYIDSNEGWSEGVYAYKDIMATFGNCNDILQSFYLYYAYDRDGIYYAADILDNSFILSTGEDDIDNKINDFNIKNENVYGYNGDIFTFTVDPLGLFFDAGYYSNQDYNAWYSVGIFEGNLCRMYRGHNRSGDITSEVKLQGQVTEAGWRFEAFIPWEFLCQDAEDMSYAEFSPTVEDMTKNGAVHRAMAIYLDRFMDPEAEEVTTFQRFATCGYKLADGLLGYLSSGVCLKAYGITLSFEGDGSESENTTEDAGKETDPVIDETLDTETAVDSDTSELKDTADTVTETDDVDTAETSDVNTEKDSKDTADSEVKQDSQTQTTSVLTTDKGSDRFDTKTTTAVKNNKVTTAKVNTTKAQNTSAATGTSGGSAQTFDMGVAVAIGGIVIAIIAFIFIKKKL